MSVMILPPICSVCPLGIHSIISHRNSFIQIMSLHLSNLPIQWYIMFTEFNVESCQTEYISKYSNNYSTNFTIFCKALGMIQRTPRQDISSHLFQAGQIILLGIWGLWQIADEKKYLVLLQAGGRKIIRYIQVHCRPRGKNIFIWM